MTAFTDTSPDLETYWRSIILFGRNVASYKFALAKSLIEIGGREHELIKLEDLAEPFSSISSATQSKAHLLPVNFSTLAERTTQMRAHSQT